MTELVPAPLEALAVEIRREVDAAEADFQSAVAHAIRAGELLIEAKQQVRHGEWLPWLAVNFPASEDTAQLYMRMARNTERVRYLPSIRGAIAELSDGAPPSLDLGGDRDQVAEYVWGARPLPDRFRRAAQLMREWRDKRRYVFDDRAWLEPPDDFMPGEHELLRKRRWLEPAPGHRFSVESGHACTHATAVLAEMTLLEAQIRALAPETEDHRWMDAATCRAEEMIELLDQALAGPMADVRGGEEDR